MSTMDRVALMEQKIVVLQQEIADLKRGINQALLEFQTTMQSLGGFASAGMQSLDKRLTALEPHPIREDDTGREL